MIRDWRQSWDPKAEFVFIRAIPKMIDRDYVPGDRLPARVRAHLGPNGMLAFWKAGAIARTDGPFPYTGPFNDSLPTAEVAPTPEPVLVGPSTDASVETPTLTDLPKRKRGRPSNAERAARAAAEAAQVNGANPNA